MAQKLYRLTLPALAILTPVGLAYWIMDDGGFTGTGLKLYTNAFSQEELNLLVEALDKKSFATLLKPLYIKVLLKTSELYIFLKNNYL